LHGFDLEVTFTSDLNLQSLLDNTKDELEPKQMSGIYENNCKDSEQKYMEQTKRSILIRFKEHMRHVKYNDKRRKNRQQKFLKNSITIFTYRFRLETIHCFRFFLGDFSLE
jgi:hypothetical protein